MSCLMLLPGAVQLSQRRTQSIAQVCIIWLSSLTSRGSNLNPIPIRKPGNGSVHLSSAVTLATRHSCLCVFLNVTLALHFCWMYPHCHLPPPPSIPTPDYGQLLLPLQPTVFLSYTRTGALDSLPNFRYVRKGNMSHYLSPNKNSMGKK